MSLQMYHTPNSVNYSVKDDERNDRSGHCETLGLHSLTLSAINEYTRTGKISTREKLECTSYWRIH